MKHLICAHTEADISMFFEAYFSIYSEYEHAVL